MKKFFLPIDFKQKLFGFVLYTIFFLFFAKSVYFNVTLYKHYGVGKVNNISQSAMSEGTGSRTHYDLKTNDNKRVAITYMDNGEDPLGLEMGDTIIFRYVGGVNVQALKRNGVEIGSYFQFWDYFSLIMTIILGLGYYYIPKFYKKNENEENKKITDWLVQKNKKILMISIVIFLNLQNSMGQWFVMKEKTNFSLPVKENLMNYTIYPSNSIIEGIYKNIKESKNIFPEEVLISILSATDYEWDKSNYDYLINNNVQKYKLMTSPSQKPQIVLFPWSVELRCPVARSPDQPSCDSNVPS